MRVRTATLHAHQTLFPLSRKGRFGKENKINALKEPDPNHDRNRSNEGKWPCHGPHGQCNAYDNSIMAARVGERACPNLSDKKLLERLLHFSQFGMDVLHNPKERILRISLGGVVLPLMKLGRPKQGRKTRNLAGWKDLIWEKTQSKNTRNHPRQSSPGSCNVCQKPPRCLEPE